MAAVRVCLAVACLCAHDGCALCAAPAHAGNAGGDKKQALDAKAQREALHLCQLVLQVPLAALALQCVAVVLNVFLHHCCPQKRLDGAVAPDSLLALISELTSAESKPLSQVAKACRVLLEPRAAGRTPTASKKREQAAGAAAAAPADASARVATSNGAPSKKTKLHPTSESTPLKVQRREKDKAKVKAKKSE